MATMTATPDNIAELDLATRRTRAEAAKLEAEADKLMAEQHKLAAEQLKLAAERLKLQAEATWARPVVLLAVAAVFGIATSGAGAWITHLLK
jgi:hypothetical protein